MRILLDRIDDTVFVEAEVTTETDLAEVADTVHDGLVSVWEHPRAKYEVMPEQLKYRETSWDFFGKSARKVHSRRSEP